LDITMPNQTRSRLSAPAAWLLKTFNTLTCTENEPASVPESALESNVRALLRELEVTAERVAISCAIANAAEQGITIPAHQAIRYFPDRPTVFTAILHGTKLLYLDRDSIASFSALYEATAFAVEFSLGQSNDKPPHASTPAWRTAARHAIEALHQAHVLANNLGAAYRIPDAEMVVTKLGDVASGATTGVNPNGTINSPSLRDDRRQIRYPKSMPATLQLTSGTAPVMLRDISTGGCGFATTRHFIRGTDVTLILPDQSRFEGKIAWSLGLSAGIEFTTPITESQAMFAGERRER
jgi:hypothetical protein